MVTKRKGFPAVFLSVGRQKNNSSTFRRTLAAAGTLALATTRGGRRHALSPGFVYHSSPSMTALTAASVLFVALSLRIVLTRWNLTVRSSTDMIMPIST